MERFEAEETRLNPEETRTKAVKSCLESLPQSAFMTVNRPQRTRDQLYMYTDGGPSAQGGTPTHFETVPEAVSAARGVPGGYPRARLYACRGWVRPRHT